jgi:hypothetical protein
VVQIELAASREDRFDVAVGSAVGGAERLGWGDEGFAGQGPSEQVKKWGRQGGEVAAGAVLDLALVAGGLAQQVPAGTHA